MDINSFFLFVACLMFGVFAFQLNSKSNYRSVMYYLTLFCCYGSVLFALTLLSLAFYTYFQTYKLP